MSCKNAATDCANLFLLNSAKFVHYVLDTPVWQLLQRLGTKEYGGDRRKGGWERCLQKPKTYYEMPVDVMEDAEELTIWAQQANNL